MRATRVYKRRRTRGFSIGSNIKRLYWVVAGAFWNPHVVHQFDAFTDQSLVCAANRPDSRGAPANIWGISGGLDSSVQPLHHC